MNMNKIPKRRFQRAVYYVRYMYLYHRLQMWQRHATLILNLRLSNMASISNRKAVITTALHV